MPNDFCTPLSSSPYKIAYLILAHRNLEQLEELIAALRHPQAQFYLHIDPRTVRHHSFLNSQRGRWMAQSPDITLAKRQYPSPWGSFGLVRATLELLCTAYEADDTQRFVLLSGEDFPLCSAQSIHSFFMTEDETSYIKAKAYPEFWDDEIMNRRFSCYWLSELLGETIAKKLVALQQRIPFIQRSPLPKHTLYKGSQWWALTRHCVAFILSTLQSHPELYRYFYLSLVADESFFCTLLYNSPLQTQLENRSLTFEQRGNKASGFAVQYLQVDDLANDVGKFLFARKIDFTRCPELRTFFQKVRNVPTAR